MVDSSELLARIERLRRISVGLLTIGFLAACEQFPEHLPPTKPTEVVIFDASATPTPTFEPTTSPTPEPTPEVTPLELATFEARVVFNDRNVPYVEITPGSVGRIDLMTANGEHLYIMSYQGLDYIVYAYPTEYKIVHSTVGLPALDINVPPMMSPTVPDTLLFHAENGRTFTFNYVTGDVEEIILTRGEST